jgi:hypothetical protein
VASGFTPTVGDIYPIVTYTSETGTFATIKVSGLSASLSLTPAYNAKDFTLTAASASSSIPAPASVIGPLDQVEPSGSGAAASLPVPDRPPAPVTIPSGPHTAAASVTPARLAHSPSRAAEARRPAVAHPGHARVFHSVRRDLGGAGKRTGARVGAARSVSLLTARTSWTSDRRPR